MDLAADENGYLKTDSLSSIYGIFMAQSGDKDVRPADEGNRAQNGKLGKITYVLDGGTLPADALTEYGSDDFGYAPPTPVRADYKFIGWEPAQISTGSSGNVTFTAQWVESSAELLSGREINVKMKKLAGNRSASYNREDTAITAIQRSDEAPSDTVMEDTNSLISTSASGKPVYAWFEDGTIKWWSDAEYVNASSDLSYLCYNMNKLTDISGLATWDVSNVTYMDAMFSECSQLTDLTPPANWNTSNVTHMKSMFYDCSQLTDLTPLANWKTGKVTNMREMFSGCKQLTDLAGLANWDTSKVTNMDAMFSGCRQLTDLAPLANWQTGNVADMGDMFQECSQLTALTGLANWDTSKVTSMSSMFARCSQLTDASAINDWNIAKVTNFNAMFNGCPSHPTFTKRAGTWSNGTLTPTTE